MKKILIFLCSILIFSCQEQVVELEIPGHTPFLVVNGILDTDSIMSLHVSNSVGAFQQGQISSISDANVLLYENNNLLGEMSVDFNTQDSIYILEQSVKAENIIKKFIEEIKLEFNLTNKQICLSGFSQGCMMSLNAGLSEKEKFAGILGFSGKIINKIDLDKRIFSKPSILLIHGDQDEIVPPVNLLEAKDFFERNKIDITTKMLKGCGHNIPVEASSLGLTFLKKIFNINS